MKAAIVMYDKLNLLNFAQINGFLRRFDGVRVQTYALKPEIIDECGTRVHAQVCGDSLYGADVLIVPDGVGALGLRYDEIFLSWIKSGASARVKLGFDLGALILGGAGWLAGGAACVRAGYKNAIGEYCEFSQEIACEFGEILTISRWGEVAERKICEKLGI